jgi:predicted aspartyl protease
MIKILLFSSFLLLSFAVKADERIFVPLKDTGGATYFLNGQIQGVGKIEWLLDTGSGYPVIDYKMLHQLRRGGMARYQRNITAVLADGRKRLIPIYKIHSITLGDRCKVSQVEVAIFRNIKRGIIGMNVLTRLAPFEFAGEPLGIRFSHCESAKDSD